VEVDHAMARIGPARGWWTLVRSERAFCEELDFQLLYRWFLDMSLMEPSFDPTVFTKNRSAAHEVHNSTGNLRAGLLGVRSTTRA
jgi:hypothetical protein